MLVPFLQILLIFLFPVAVYCWVLGMINRRTHPLMVSGRWDCVGLLFAASGFLLVVAPAVISGMYYRLLHELTAQNLSRPGWALLWTLFSYYWALWVGYYVLMLAGVFLVLWKRGSTSVVYNVNTAVLNRALAEALDRLGSAWTRHGNRLFLTAPGVPVVDVEPALTPTALAAKPAPLRRVAEQAEQKAILDVEPFAAMFNVTLHWRSGAPQLREEVQAELTRVLTTVETEENPAGTWLLAASTCMFGLMFLIALSIIIGAALGHRH